jgi:hypothetical protein
MATNDLQTELTKETFKMDVESEKKICNMIVKLLFEDSSGDVQGLAVKWYASSPQEFATSILILTCFFQSRATRKEDS